MKIEKSSREDYCVDCTRCDKEIELSRVYAFNVRHQGIVEDICHWECLTQVEQTTYIHNKRKKTYDKKGRIRAEHYEKYKK